MTTIIERPATPTTFVPPATRFRRRAMGAAAVVGGLLTAAGFAATVRETGPEKLAYLDSLVVDPLRSQVAAVLLHYGYMGIVPMLLALAAMTRSRWRIGGNIGLALSLPGAFAVTGMLVTDFYDLAIRQSLPAEQAVGVSNAGRGAPARRARRRSADHAHVRGHDRARRRGVAGRVLPLGHGAAGARLGRDHRLPVGAVQGITQGALLGLFMVLVGVAAWRMTDEEWVTGLRRPLNP